MALCLSSALLSTLHYKQMKKDLIANDITPLNRLEGQGSIGTLGK